MVLKMERKNLALILIVVAVVFLVLSITLVFSLTSIGKSIHINKVSSRNAAPAGGVQLLVEGNEFSEVGK